LEIGGNVKVLNARVDWYTGWNNDPKLEILVDKLPDDKSMRYEKRGEFYFAELEGLVRFFIHDAQNGTGFGGSTFVVTMKDGTTESIKGPWSSRPACATALGFTPSADVVIFDDIESWDRGWVGLAGHITEQLFRETVAKFLDGVKVSTKDHHGEPVLFLSWVDDPCEVCKGFTVYKDTTDSPARTCRWCGGTGHESDHAAIVEKFHKATGEGK